ncbi:OV-16 antigen [Smittium culicis]|uniref:OV-16 antigen n=1 Tax=Smittium culicis TaxID=133412 RepID=A0A1R1XE42_9FUNG|nr:OV-16 antigen [Smittium culicis]
MKFLSLAVISAAVSSFVAAQTFNSAAIVEALDEGDIIDDVLPESFTPITTLDVTYENRPMNFGTEYFPYNNETDTFPTVNYNSNANDLYTLALVDPDAPSRANPIRAQVVHFLSINIRGNDIQSGFSGSLTYLPTRPFVGCGRKRFVFVLARQAGVLANSVVPASRPGFNIANFAAQNQLTLIGANYFEAESTPGPQCIIPSASPSASASPASSSSSSGSDSSSSAFTSSSSSITSSLSRSTSASSSTTSSSSRSTSASPASTTPSSGSASVSPATTTSLSGSSSSRSSSSSAYKISSGLAKALSVAVLISLISTII